MVDYFIKDDIIILVNWRIFSNKYRLFKSKMWFLLFGRY